jgi:hypothetical protein
MRHIAATLIVLRKLFLLPEIKDLRTETPRRAMGGEQAAPVNLVI